jgi:lipopolysaccharide export system ATP-binding protein
MIMLDEPFAGIDPKTVSEIQDGIRELARVHHIGILLTDHNFRETLEVTDRSYLIREGAVFAAGTPEEILRNADVRRYYLGERFDAGHLLEQVKRHALPSQSAQPPPMVVIDHVDDQPGPGRALHLGIDQEQHKGRQQQDPQDEAAEPGGM